ncbi:MAG TPA: CvpA family protein [Pseudolabrys sp.]|nr:CvpA family protein [Pseudolabrys sp.]
MTSFFSTNWFDLAIYVCLFAAVVMGFMTGLLRSLATIFGYIAGMGIAVAVAPCITPLLTSTLKMPTLQTWLVIVAIFVAAGAVLSALLRLALNEMVGPNISVPDRIAGAALGALRIALLAILLVVVFDRAIPPGQEPAFLKGSQWRPVLSSAAERGLHHLPPDVEAYIDRLKHYRRVL